MEKYDLKKEAVLGQPVFDSNFDNGISIKINRGITIKIIPVNTSFSREEPVKSTNMLRKTLTKSLYKPIRF